MTSQSTNGRTVIRYAVFSASMLFGTCITTSACAHGYAGTRFFPATIATDDPAVADELSLPTLSRLDGEIEISGEFSKRITKRLGFSIEGAWTRANEDGEAIKGFENIETSLNWQFLTNAEHEAIVTAGVSVEWGGTGAQRIGAEETSVVTPTLYFGKGFGNLPERANWARPFAVTGLIGYAVPARAFDDAGDAIPSAITGGFTVQYSLPYLNANIRDRNWPAWVNRLTPLVELAIEKPVRRAGGEAVTGSINPGFVWTGKHMQFGAEAIIPVNDDSGNGVGWTVQAHFFLDDLLPRSIGRPIFGRRK